MVLAENIKNIDLLKKELSFSVPFTQKEIDFINKLSKNDLQKVLDAIKKIVEQIKQGQLLNTGAGTGSLSTNTNSTPIYSNTPTPQTPHYNPQTGQYQSLPAGSPNTPGGAGFSPGSFPSPSLGSPSGGGAPSPSGSPYTSGLPFKGETGSPPATFPAQPFQSSGPFSTLFNQRPLDDVTLPTNISPRCRVNFGATGGGRCTDAISGLSNIVKKSLMESCELIGGPVPVNSGYRDPACNRMVGGASGSMHTRGLAVDINAAALGDKAKNVWLVFKKNGARGIGCYSPSVVHLDFGSARRWGSNRSASTYNPRNCPKYLIQVFGN